MKCTKVGLVGFGTVGTGVARLLLEQQERISHRCGQEVRLVKIVDADVTRKRTVDVPDGVLTDDIHAILDDPEISIVVQLIGGTGIEREIMLKMLAAGKNIVTANKALLATCGNEIFDAARKNNCSVAFEAAVAGGIPVIKAVSESLAANEIQGIQAILNGTCNFILSSMEKKGSDYADALAEAQKLGYAEANPDMDVQGKDATQKIVILSQIAFGVQADWQQVAREGITTVSGVDFQLAKSRGYTIRLIATARKTPAGEVEIMVSPTWVKLGTPLAGVDDAFNAVSVQGDALGQVFLYGRGAGEMPTASAVVADVMDTVLGRAAITFGALDLWNEKNTACVKMADPAAIRGAYYLRLTPAKENAEAEILRSLEASGISVDVTLPYPENGAAAIFALITRETTQKALLSALETLETAGLIREKAVKMRFIPHP